MRRNLELIADLGSCHLGKIENVFKAVDRCVENKVDVLKFQLFGEEFAKNGNIIFERSWWKDVYEYAVCKNKLSITASVFDMEAVRMLNDYYVPFIKLAFSQKDKVDEVLRITKHHIMLSCDEDSIEHFSKYEYVTKLYCVSQYPVPYEIDFEGLPKKFDGFSDHTRGVKQTKRAIDEGFLLIEKHLRLDGSSLLRPSESYVPDYKVAVTARDFRDIRTYYELQLMKSERQGMAEKLKSERLGSELTNQRIGCAL